MPLRLAKLRPDTLDALDALAREHQRSRPDVVAALATMGADYPETLRHALAKIEPLQALRGTGRRARRAAKRGSEEEKSEIDIRLVDRKSTSG
jgi:hypothetical protein